MPISLSEGRLKCVIALIAVVGELHDVLVRRNQSAAHVRLENRVKRPAAIKGCVIGRGTGWSSLLASIVIIPASKRSVIQAPLIKQVLSPGPHVGNSNYAVPEHLVLNRSGVIVKPWRQQRRNSSKYVKGRRSGGVPSEC